MENHISQVLIFMVIILPKITLLQVSPNILGMHLLQINGILTKQFNSAKLYCINASQYCMKETANQLIKFNLPR